ncbi:MAG: NFACT family protein, partial [Bacilli bacterium]|nr:NFACT family protein [Bacilli bacterium]
MALRSKQIRLIAEYLASYRGARVSKWSQVDKAAFSFSLGRDLYLTLNLDNRDPCLFLGEEEAGRNISTPLSAMLRKMLSGASIKEVTQENHDRVLRLSFNATNEVYEPIVLHLVAELIPTKANLALLDENDRILACLRSNTILDPRPIFHGITYTPPLQK